MFPTLLPNNRPLSTLEQSELQILLRTEDGRIKGKGTGGSSPKPESSTASNSTPTLKTTTAIAADPTLGFKIRALLFDLNNLAQDIRSMNRLDQTLDEHYISTPYFDEQQATMIKAATVDAELDPAAVLKYSFETEDFQADVQGKTFDEAIRILLNSHFDQRRASGDHRPCGPQDLAPRYLVLFGINEYDLEDARFTTQLSRNGVQ